MAVTRGCRRGRAPPEVPPRVHVAAALDEVRPLEALVVDPGRVGHDVSLAHLEEVLGAELALALAALLPRRGVEVERRVLVADAAPERPELEPTGLRVVEHPEASSEGVPVPLKRFGTGFDADHFKVALKNAPWPRLAHVVPGFPSRSSFRPHPCLSGACFGCTDQAAGSSSLSASAAAAVACTLPGL